MVTVSRVDVMFYAFERQEPIVIPKRHSLSWLMSLALLLLVACLLYTSDAADE